MSRPRGPASGEISRALAARLGYVPPVPPREVCRRCLRPSVTCHCAHVKPQDTRTRVLILQHPRERGFAIGTALMTHLVLPNSILRVGVEFDQDEVVQAAINDPERPAVLLFPGKQAVELTAGEGGPVTLVVLDGTWWQARKLLSRNPALRELPRRLLDPESPSRYRIRREPSADYLSTVEAVSTALRCLEGDTRASEALLRPFDAMVERQLEFAHARKGQPSRHFKTRPDPAI